MKRVSIGLLLLWALSQGASAQPSRWITAQDWARPRSGEALVQLPALKESVAELLATHGARLLVRFPSGEEGVLWAEELRGWLVALGIPSSQIELVPGGIRPDAVELRLAGGNGR